MLKNIVLKNKSHAPIAKITGEFCVYDGKALRVSSLKEKLKKPKESVNNDLCVCFPLKMYGLTLEDLEYTIEHIHVGYIYGLSFILVC